MPKIIILLGLAFSISLVSASESEQVALPLDDKISSLELLGKMSLPQTNTPDYEFISGLANTPGVFIPMSDFYWAKTCANTYDGYMDFVKQHSSDYQIGVLSALYGSKESPTISAAYGALIHAARVINCADNDSMRSLHTDFAAYVEGAQ